MFKTYKKINKCLRHIKNVNKIKYIKRNLNIQYCKSKKKKTNVFNRLIYKIIYLKQS